MKTGIELKQKVPAQAPCYTELWVNGYRLGEYIHGKDKVYLYPERWASNQIKKRLPVIARNINRLKQELEKWEAEYKALQT